MAKKKSSAKQTKQVKKASPKKAGKKAAPKKKPVVKKAAPKAATKKKTAPVKKTAKKVAPKKAATKKSPVKKAAAKKSAPKKATKSAVKPVAKPSSAKPANQHLLRAVAPVKQLDLSNFVTPLDDRLIVQLSGAEKMTAGGLYIPDTVSDVSGNLHGTVVAAGRGHVSKKGHLRPMDVKVGDKIVFAEYAGSKIKIQNEDLVIIREGDVMGVVAK